MDDVGWVVLARVADITGVVAFGAVVFGVVSAWLARPRLRLLTQGPMGMDRAVMSLVYEAGAAPASNVLVGFATLDSDGHARSGEGGVISKDTFYGKDDIGVIVKGREVNMPDVSDALHITFGLEPGDGVMIDFSWRNPFIPWLRTLWLAVWTPEVRAARGAPVVMKGRMARRYYKQAMELAATF